jgi:hypothetical protein
MAVGGEVHRRKGVAPRITAPWTELVIETKTGPAQGKYEARIGAGAETEEEQRHILHW